MSFRPPPQQRLGIPQLTSLQPPGSLPSGMPSVPNVSLHSIPPPPVPPSYPGIGFGVPPPLPTQGAGKSRSNEK